MADIEANRAIVARFFETYSSGDLEAVLDALDDSASWWVSGRLAGVSGRYSKAEFAPLLLGTKALYQGAGLRITPVSMVAEGDKVAVEAEGFAVLQDGLTYDPHYHFAITLREGRIAEVREYMDTLYSKELFFPG